MKLIVICADEDYYAYYGKYYVIAPDDLDSDKLQKDITSFRNSIAKYIYYMYYKEHCETPREISACLTPLIEKGIEEASKKYRQLFEDIGDTDRFCYAIEHFMDLFRDAYPEYNEIVECTVDWINCGVFDF